MDRILCWNIGNLKEKTIFKRSQQESDYNSVFIFVKVGGKATADSFQLLCWFYKNEGI